MLDHTAASSRAWSVLVSGFVDDRHASDSRRPLPAGPFKTDAGEAEAPAAAGNAADDAAAAPVDRELSLLDGSCVRDCSESVLLLLSFLDGGHHHDERPAGSPRQLCCPPSFIEAFESKLQKQGLPGGLRDRPVG